MIHLCSIFKQLRETKGYLKKSLANHLDISLNQVRSYEDDPYQQIPYATITQWAKFLDLLDNEILWCIQYYEREQTLHGMTYTDVPYADRRKISDFCTIFQKLPTKEVQAILTQMQRLTLPHLLVQPQPIREAIYDIESQD